MPKQDSLVIFFIFLFLITPFFAKAATLYLMPPSQTIYQGSSFMIEIRLDSKSEEINTVEGNLNFPPELLEIVDFSKGGSILSFWAKEPFLERGEISFLGGIPGGFRGEGSILKINFLAKEIGKADILFTGDSKVLLNDGKGTSAKLNFLEGNYEIIRRPEGLPLISSPTHPDQNKWYKGNTLHLHWDLVEGAEYSFILSQDPLAEPDETPDKPEGELIWMGDMEYPNLEDGIYYFFLKQKLPGKDWSPKVAFRAMIDATPPEPFELKIGQDASMFGGKYFVSFLAIDKTSGIDHYEIQEGKGDFREAKSPYLLGDQSLRNKIIVKVVDKAGNERISELMPPRKAFAQSLFIQFVIILILVILVIWCIWWLIKKSRKKTIK